MAIITILFAIAFVITLGWAIWLWRHRTIIVASPAPIPELFAPIFHAAGAALDLGLVVLDQERQIRYLNQQAAALLNVESSDALGAGLIALVRDYQADTLVQDVLRDGEAREIVLRQAIGGRTLRLRARLLDAPELRGAVVLIRDVTQLSILERARRDMVANVSHELRTPLASIKLLVETLQSAPPPLIAERMLSQMAQEVDAVTQLVDELHELSQIEAGRVALQLAPTVIAPVTTRAIERIRPQAERKDLHVRAEVADQLPLVLMDAGRIGQVLLNLLHNAIKFTPSGGRIILQAQVLVVEPETPTLGYIEQPLTAEPTSALVVDQSVLQLTLPQRSSMSVPALGAGNWMLLSISDTGIGIPRAELPRVFERFYKVDRARTRNAGGTGLGLAIAKHLVEGHGGQIWVTSTEGVGSVFYFVLPLA